MWLPVRLMRTSAASPKHLRWLMEKNIAGVSLGCFLGRALKVSFNLFGAQNAIVDVARSVSGRRIIWILRNAMLSFLIPGEE